MITYAPILLTSKYETRGERQSIYIYQLRVEGKPFYVGSTVVPTYRYIEHLRGETPNTAKRIRAEMEAGKEIEMHLVDACRKAHREYVEAFWIFDTEGSINEQRYYKKLSKYLSNRAYYPSVAYPYHNPELDFSGIDASNDAKWARISQQLSSAASVSR